MSEKFAQFRFKMFQVTLRIVKTFIVIPTYRESATIKSLIDQIVALKIPELSILVVDDASPDGTAEIVSQLAKENSAIQLVERLDEKGKGTASLVGFDLALQMGADRIVEMEADLSHPPLDILKLLDALGEADIAIASRLVVGGSDLRPKAKRVFTFFNNFYIRVALERGIHKSVINDWTSGFRAYRREVLVRIPPFTLLPGGAALAQELLFRALNLGMKVKEIPIQLQGRANGSSTINLKTAFQGFVSVLAYAILYRFRNMDFCLGNLEAHKVADGRLQVKKTAALESHFQRTKINIV
jgi:dolichol-phosphate mannosyltransferase